MKLSAATILEIIQATPASSTRVILLLRFIALWIGFLLVWLVFVFQVTASELAVGALASAMTVVLTHVTFRVVPGCFQPRLRWVVQTWHLPAMIASDLWLLLKHLAREIGHRPSQSSFEVTRFRATGEDCRAAAQRALAVLFVSTSPNSVVIDMDKKKGEMFFHQLEPAAVPKLLRNLEE